MPLFMTDVEFERERGNVNAVVTQADVYIRDLQQQLETHKARADAAAINAEQTCALIEQKYLTLTAQFSQVENEKEQSFATLERRSTELAQAQAQIHKLEIEAIKHNSATERLSFEVGELVKAKRELLDVVEQKNLELEEKNASIKTYLNKVVELTDERSVLEGKVHEHESEVVRSRASFTRVLQEKELLEQHNAWLNEELTAKANTLLEERHESAETEADLRSKLAEAERAKKDAGEAIQRLKEHNLDLESKLSQTREELKSLKEDSAVMEEQFTAEVATATKLVELYKQSSDDWSKKSHELEGVIKALETHLNQVEAEYKEKLDTEVKARKEATKEAAEAKEKLEKAVAEMNTEMVKSREGGDFLALLDKPYTGTGDGQLALEFPGDGSLIPVVASEVSGTALAAALLRDGWSLAKIYSKYQEAVDAWRHERHERHHSQALLERVLHEIELRAEVIMDERAAHMEMVEAYHRMEEKLQHFMEDQNVLESSCKELKAELRKKERELKLEQKEVTDLQTQVAVLLKECSDVQQRFGVGDQNGAVVDFVTTMTETTAVDTVISERLLTFKDIRGMVQHNTQLRTLVRTLGQQNELKERELKEEFELELKRHLDEIGQKVAETVKRSEEQADIIARLQGTVGMYRRLYEEEMSAKRALQPHAGLPLLAPRSENSNQDLSKLLDSSQEEIAKMREEGASRIKQLEEELTKARQEITKLRVEGARFDGEATFAREQLSTLMRETENRRKEMESVLARNMEFSQTIADYQRRLRENAQKLQAAEDLARRRSIDASVAEREKELLAAAEKRSSEEVAKLSESVHRLQAVLDTLQTSEEARESVKAGEKKKLEDELNNLQKEWAEARRELEMERARGRDLINQRDRAVSEALERVEAVSKELADALKSLSAAETRAQVAEARCMDLEMSLKKSDDKVLLALGGAKTVVHEDSVAVDVDSEIMLSLQQAKGELERVNEDLAAAKVHTDQYKKIALVSEEALKQMEGAYENYKEESERRKEALASEVRDLQKRLNDVEMEVLEKDKATGALLDEKDTALTNALKEISSLKESLSIKEQAIVEADGRITTLKQEVDKLHQQWRDAQNNYERQVLLQADTIRDLTITSDKLSNLESVERSLREQAESAQAELEMLQVSMAMEKSRLEGEKLEVEKKVKELDEQNQKLLDRLEGVHVLPAVTEQKPPVTASESGQTSEVSVESDLQNVIRFLRRSKETVDTELTLMKQERVRLQKQLEGAHRAAEEAQASLRREHESSRASLYSDEEFRTLQAQVRELNLLRESNAELREENKKGFEDCKEWQEKAREARAELEPLRKLLREKEVDLEASGRILESQKAQTQRWEKRVRQMLEKYKSVDLDEYQRVKSELAAAQEQEKVTSTALEVSKKQTQEFKSLLTKIEEEKQAKETNLAEIKVHVADVEKKLQDALQSEGSVKVELTRFKKHAAFQKKKIDDITKEKDESVKETENLKKLIEELRSSSGRRAAGDQLAARTETVNQLQVRLDQSQKDAIAQKEQFQQAENQLKERDTRIQVLEKALEREKEQAKKEKFIRLKNEKHFFEVAQKQSEDHKKLMEELNNLKAEKNLIQVPSAPTGHHVEPSAEITELDKKAGNSQGNLQQMAPGVAPETPDVVVSSMSSMPPASTIAPEVSTPSKTDITIDMVSEEPSLLDAPTTSAVPVLPNVESSVVLPTSTPGSLVSSTSGIPPAGPPLRPVMRSAPSNVAAGSSRASVRNTPGGSNSIEADKAREIEQLRAQIEKAAAVQAAANARKGRPRLVRPKIEPAGITSNTSTTPGETSQERVAEGADTDGEVMDEVKTSEATVVPSGSLINPAGAGVAPTLPVSVARKRGAPLLDSGAPDDELMHQDSAIENAPPQKKFRSAGESSLDDPYSFVDVPTPLVEGEPVGGSFKEEENAIEDQPLVTSKPQSDSLENVNPDTDMDRPVSESSDVPAAKKPRIVQPGMVSMLSHPFEGGPSVQTKDAVMQKDVFDVSGKDLSKEEENNAGDIEGESGGNLSKRVNESWLMQEVPNSMEDIQVTELPSAMDDIIVTDISSTDLLDLMGGSGVDEAIAQFQGASSSLEMNRDFPTESTIVTRVVEEKTVSVTETVVVEVEEKNVEDAEEGEIVSEVLEDEPTAIELGTASESVPIEGKSDELEEPEIKEIEEATEVDADQPLELAEGAGGSNSQVGTELSSSQSLGNPDNGQPSETSSLNDKAAESLEVADVASGHRTRLATGTVIKPVGRGTTINLADRAKERAALRRGVSSPPSPGVRGRGRGRTGRGKRGGAAGQGRLISTGAGGRGEASGTPQAGAQQVNPGEGVQQQSTRTPFDAPKDDQS